MKRRIRLTESQLHNMICESVKTTLNEVFGIEWNRGNDDEWDDEYDNESSFLTFVNVLEDCGWSYFNYQDLGDVTRYTLEKDRNGCDVETLKAKLTEVIPDIQFGEAQYRYAPEIKHITAILKN